ncbi:triosephosphate isomerase [Caballeronia hypogeia]|uniref:Triosephosphate isomerase n=1 Tax=Caballeronia hypogeia TaxID=1777140 RepID=A0A158CCA9_9BURK|nr:triose-phosphate isomerase [Caballeronia hypogeia]SAK79934.1 triosephosphate isomerase [Caballeronia hypogeia]
MGKQFVLGNWKMNGSSVANAELLKGVLTQEADPRISVGVCVPSIYISQAQSLLANTGIALGVQDVSAHTSGAYTGEISADMVAEFGVSYALVGHSERRFHHRESSDVVGRKAARCISSGITPVVCVGETFEERQAGETNHIIERQLTAVLESVGSEGIEKIIVAYEPVWAIGTGLSASASQAQEAHAFLRSILQEHAPNVARTPILYGGSVKSSSASNIFAQPDVDGGLVGGAALDAAEFLAIINSFPAAVSSHNA